MNAVDPRRGTWHAGERAAQARAGTAEHMAHVGPQVIRPFMPDQHRVFFAQLPFVVVGALDAAGQPWASILTGLPGFMHSPHPQRLEIAAAPVAGDPLQDALRLGAPIGLLGIELPTRRRNRMNGFVIVRDGNGFAVEVEESFGNCPQYIQRRDYVAFSPASGAAESFDGLPDEAAALIRRADTMFVASAAPTDDGDYRVDVSHRGGRPGFLGIDRRNDPKAAAIVVPDFRGNGFFQTLGNLTAYPKAGLLIPDFATGDLLQIAGDAEIVWDGPEVEAFPGAQRLWKVRPRIGHWLRGAFPLRFGEAELSPRSRAVGVYAQG
ncbi:MAG TPA: pyridoxamine 5'-phosphate oxidase family protein [Dongiaceae bacterium]|nr:pyridoxamine 5'-phosphate oxidase family protein [Dongiaceae bacterium]